MRVTVVRDSVKKRMVGKGVWAKRVDAIVQHDDDCSVEEIRRIAVEASGESLRMLAGHPGLGILHIKAILEALGPEKREVGVKILSSQVMSRTISNKVGNIELVLPREAEINFWSDVEPILYDWPIWHVAAAFVLIDVRDRGLNITSRLTLRLLDGIVNTDDSESEIIFLKSGECLVEGLLKSITDDGTINRESFVPLLRAGGVTAAAAFGAIGRLWHSRAGAAAQA